MNTEIVDLEKVILPKYLCTRYKLKSYETKALTAPGENYGSLMLAVDVTRQDTTTNDEDHIHIVAKMVPNNEFIQKMFQSPLTFKKELELYQTIVPTLQQFQLEHGIYDVIDCFPEFYGGRLGLTDDEHFDSHAVILLENLKSKGYVTVERTQGFNLQTSKLIIRDLAKFHGVSIAMKLQIPDLFYAKIKPYLIHMKIFSAFNDDMMNDIIKNNLKIAEEDPECGQHLEAIEKALRHAKKSFEGYIPPNELWATMTHCDFWVNNTLVKFDDTGKAVKNKMVDFQIIDYYSVAKDLSFFLFVSVQNDVVVNNYDELFNEYYNTFIDTLKTLKVDTTLFTIESLEEEMKNSVKDHTIMQCLCMLKPIFAPLDAVKNVEDLSMEDIEDKREATPLHKEKFWMIVKEFLKRNWI